MADLDELKELWAAWHTINLEEPGKAVASPERKAYNEGLDSASRETKEHLSSWICKRVGDGEILFEGSGLYLLGVERSIPDTLPEVRSSDPGSE